MVYRTMTQEDFGVFCVVSNLCYFCFLSSLIDSFWRSFIICFMN